MEKFFSIKNRKADALYFFDNGGMLVTRCKDHCMFNLVRLNYIVSTSFSEIHPTFPSGNRIFRHAFT